MSLVPIIFFLAGRLCCRANCTFAAGLTLRRHEADLFQAYWLSLPNGRGYKSWVVGVGVGKSRGCG